MHVEDLKELSIGMVTDIFTEAGNDQYEYDVLATQDDFEKF